LSAVIDRDRDAIRTAIAQSCLQIDHTLDANAPCRFNDVNRAVDIGGHVFAPIV